MEPESAAGKRSRPAQRALWALVLALMLPGLTVGPVFDDWFHAIDARANTSWLSRLFNLYDFFDSGEVASGKELGWLPWWTDDGLSLRFFRPLSSALLSVDHLLLDGGGFFSHLHAALWFGVASYAAHRLFRTMFSPADARWMTPLYCILGCHALPLAFAAARHSHVTAAVAFAYLECVIRSLTAPGMRLRVLASFFFLLALLAGESAVTILPIAFAYVSVEAGVGRALRAVTPELVLLAAFALVYSSAGFGAAHSGAYLQPGSAAFFAALPARWSALAGNLFSGFPSDLWLMGLEPVLVGAGIVSLLVTALGFRSVARALDSTAARRLAALLLGGLVAIVPLAGGIPGGRLVVIPSLGTAALFAFAARQAVHSFSARRGRALLLGAWVALFGIGLNPLVRVGPALEMARVARELPLVAQRVGEQCAGKVAIAVGAPDPNLSYVPMLLEGSAARPSALHIVSMTAAPHRMAQSSSGGYELQIDGDFWSLPWTRVYRDGPLQSGSTHALRGLDLQVLAADESSLRLALRPTEPACWLTLEQGRVVPLQLPAAAEPIIWTPTPRPM